MSQIDNRKFQAFYQIDEKGNLIPIIEDGRPLMIPIDSEEQPARWENIMRRYEHLDIVEFIFIKKKSAISQ